MPIFNVALAKQKLPTYTFILLSQERNKGFENGIPEVVREMVYKLHNSCLDGGYICSPYDHFFSGNPENIKAFVKAARECIYG